MTDQLVLLLVGHVIELLKVLIDVEGGVLYFFLEEGIISEGIQYEDHQIGYLIALSVIKPLVLILILQLKVVV